MREFRRTTNKRIGELLLERGTITQAQLQQAIDFQKESGGLIGEILVEKGFATEEDIVHALSSQYGFPYLPLANYEIDEQVLQSVPGDVCQRYVLIPIDKIGQSLTLAMANPLNTAAIEDVELLTGCNVQAFVSTTVEIRNSIKKYY